MNSSPHILIVDDDPELLRLLSSYLQQAQMQVSTAASGQAALAWLRSGRPDLVLLDVMLPDRDGWDITRSIRQDAALRSLPIIMLTARIGDADKIIGLELGADDYITKPFNPREVVARVRSVLRRAQPGGLPPHTLLRCTGLLLDPVRRSVTLDGAPVELTRTEFALLYTLMEHPGYVFSRSELIERSLGFEYESVERTLDSHIRNLRKKIEPDTSAPTFIQTVYGVGYRFREAVE